MNLLLKKLQFVLIPFLTLKTFYHETQIRGQASLIAVLQFHWTTCLLFFFFFKLSPWWFNSMLSNLLSNNGSFVFNLWMFYIIFIDISRLLSYFCVELILKGFNLVLCKIWWMYRGMWKNKNKELDTNLTSQKQLPKGEFFQADQCLSVLKWMQLTLVYTSWGSGYTPLIPDSKPIEIMCFYYCNYTARKICWHLWVSCLMSSDIFVREPVIIPHPGWISEEQFLSWDALIAVYTLVIAGYKLTIQLLHLRRCWLLVVFVCFLFFFSSSETHLREFLATNSRNWSC